MTEIRYIDIAEFRREGYLQEINRLLLHPLGLALAVEVDKQTGEERLKGVWDCRDDAEGVYFADGMIDAEKAAHVRDLAAERAMGRAKALGYVVQPVRQVCTCPVAAIDATTSRIRCPRHGTKGVR